jgi:RHS repeat-associated protein
VGRVVHRPGLPRIGSSDRHVLLEFTDHLGSSIATIDHATGELVQRSTFQVFGAAESDYRPPRWGSLTPSPRFSGHPQDLEVGLVYFGARYYHPALQRWISPDPLSIHDLGSDLNPYAYVGGKPSMAVDPVGLQAGCTGACEQALAQGFSPAAMPPGQVTTPIRIEAVPPGAANSVPVKGPPQWHGAMKLMVNAVPIVTGFAMIADPARTLNTTVIPRMEMIESLLGEPNTVSDTSYTPARDRGSAGQPALSDSDQLVSISVQQIVGAAAGAAVGKTASVVLGGELRVAGGAVAREGVIELAPGSSLTGSGDVLDAYGALMPTESGGYWNVLTHADSQMAWVHTGPGLEDGVFISHRSLARFITKSEGYVGQPVRLVGCNAGQCRIGLAQDLANKLGVEVLAPTGRAYIDATGHYWTNDLWQRFFPGSRGW